MRFARESPGACRTRIFAKWRIACARASRKRLGIWETGFAGRGFLLTKRFWSAAAVHLPENGGAGADRQISRSTRNSQKVGAPARKAALCGGGARSSRAC